MDLTEQERAELQRLREVDGTDTVLILAVGLGVPIPDPPMTPEKFKPLAWAVRDEVTRLRQVEASQTAEVKRLKSKCNRLIWKLSHSQ